METKRSSHLTLQPRLEVLIASLYPKTPVSPIEAFVRQINSLTLYSDTLFSHTIQLLPLLNNPLNVELLTRHILQSPAIWIEDDRQVQRHARIVAGFRASLGWKMIDFDEGKGGISIDEWIIAVGRGAIGNGSSLIGFC
jgi:hypothetical protein